MIESFLLLCAYKIYENNTVIYSCSWLVLQYKTYEIKYPEQSTIDFISVILIE